MGSAEVVRWARSVQGLLAGARPLDLPLQKLPAASDGRLPEAEGGVGEEVHGRR